MHCYSPHLHLIPPLLFLVSLSRSAISNQCVKGTLVCLEKSAGMPYEFGAQRLKIMEKLYQVLQFYLANEGI